MSVEKNCGTTSEKFSSEDRSGLFTAQLRDCADEVKSTESVLAIMPDVVEEHKRTVGPSGEDWVFKVERLDDRIDIVGPMLRVVVAVARLVRKTMTSDIQRNQSVVLDQARVHLSTPLEPTLRGPVDKHDRATVRISRFHDVELDAPTACNSMTLHRLPPLQILLPGGRSEPLRPRYE